MGSGEDILSRRSSFEASLNLLGGRREGIAFESSTNKVGFVGSGQIMEGLTREGIWADTAGELLWVLERGYRMTTQEAVFWKD